MSTKILILGLLEVEPSSGYDLAFRCMETIGPIWSATHSQIYTMLHKMLDAGEVTTKDEPCANGRKRVCYELTDKGRAELGEWRGSPLTYLPPRDPLLFWAQHLDAIPLETALIRLEEHETRAREHLEKALAFAIEIREGRNPVLERRQDAGFHETAIRRARMSRAAVHDELARRAQAEIDTVERLRQVALRIAEID